MYDSTAERSEAFSAAVREGPRRARLPFLYPLLAVLAPRRGRRSPPTTQSSQRARTSPRSKVPSSIPALASAKAFWYAVSAARRSSARSTTCASTCAAMAGTLVLNVSSTPDIVRESTATLRSARAAVSASQSRTGL